MNFHTLQWKFWPAALVLTAVALLYLFTLDNGLRPDELTGGDLITHQYAQVEARPGNAPGYPLYTMGGWLWFNSATPLFSWVLNPVQILSAYSAMWGVAALAVLYLILLQVTANRWPIAALLTAFHATTFFFWYYSVTTEQYSSAVFQTVLIIWLAFHWDDDPRDSVLLWMAFISGTMLANMVTTLFILPPLLWFIFFKNTSNHRWMVFNYLARPKLIIQAVAAALLPLISYAYIYLRGMQHPEWRGEGTWSSTWGWFIEFITIQQGRDELAPGLALQNIFTHEFPALMWHELTWPVFFGGVVGLAFLGRRRAIFLYSTLIIYFIFCWGYRFGNWFQVIIPAYPIFTIGFAALLWQTIKLATRRVSEFGQNSRSVPYISAGITIFLVGLLGYQFVTNLPRGNQRNLPTDTGLDPGWAILADSPISPALITGDFNEWVALQYLKTVWKIAPDLTPTDTTQPFTHTPAHNLYISRRAWAATQENISLITTYPQAAGEQLIALSATPQYSPAPSAVATHLDFGNRLHLAGWELVETPPMLPRGVDNRLKRANWQIALYWQNTSRQKLAVDYTISVRPLLNGQLILQGEEPIIQDHQPVWGMYPTSQWTPGEMIRDVYALNLPPGVSPDTFQIVIYNTTAAGFENLGDTIIPLQP